MNDHGKRYTGEKRLPGSSEKRAMTVAMRTYKPGDEEGMIACIREEYGETYINPDFYEPEYLQKEAGNGKFTFLAAQTDAGEIAGMLVLEELGKESALCEIESLFIRKKYRGYGLAGPLLRYGTELAGSRGCRYAAACCFPVLFHPVTQRLLCQSGFRATGLLLNVLDAAEIIHSFRKGKQSKYSLGYQILPIGKRNAGTLYVPARHRAFTESIYRGLSMKFQIAGKGESGRADMPPVSDLYSLSDRRQKSLEIWIRHTGADLPARLEEIHAGCPLTGKRTANVFLNINERWAVWAYGKLEAHHYFFTGFRPMGNAGEYMILHHAGEVGCFFEDFVVSSEFAEIRGYVRKQYERRNAHEKKKAEHPP